MRSAPGAGLVTPFFISQLLEGEPGDEQSRDVGDGGQLTLFAAGLAFGHESVITRKEVDELKTKLERLEKAIEI